MAEQMKTGNLLAELCNENLDVKYDVIDSAKGLKTGKLISRKKL